MEPICACCGWVITGPHSEIECYHSILRSIRPAAVPAVSLPRPNFVWIGPAPGRIKRLEDLDIITTTLPAKIETEHEK